LEFEGEIMTVLCYILKDKPKDTINLYIIIKHNNNERQDMVYGDKYLRQSVGKCYRKIKRGGCREEGNRRDGVLS
jgi:hypothetical protein